MTSIFMVSSIAAMDRFTSLGYDILADAIRNKPRVDPTDMIQDHLQAFDVLFR